MAAKHAGRHGRPFRRARAQVLAASQVCWLCGHDGADSVDHVIPRWLCIATGQDKLLNAASNLAPAHHKPCPTCGIRCNRARGTGTASQGKAAQSRQW